MVSEMGRMDSFSLLTIRVRRGAPAKTSRHSRRPRKFDLLSRKFNPVFNVKGSMTLAMHSQDKRNSAAVSGSTRVSWSKQYSCSFTIMPPEYTFQNPKTPRDGKYMYQIFKSILGVNIYHPSTP